MISRRRNGDTNTVCNPSLGIGIPNSSHQLSESPHVLLDLGRIMRTALNPSGFQVYMKQRSLSQVDDIGSIVSWLLE